MVCHKQSASCFSDAGRSYFYKLVIIFFLFVFNHFSANAQQDTSLKNTLPASGKLVKDKPVGKGWVNMLSSEKDWNFENQYWQLTNHVLHGTIGREKEHHYSYTKRLYTDFELNVLIKMVGDEDANS